MGLTHWLEKRAHQSWLKRSLDLSWTAADGLATVFSPIVMSLQTGAVERPIIDDAIDSWLGAWRELESQAERILGQSRDEYGLRAYVVLSPKLLEFEHRLAALRQSDQLANNELLEGVSIVNSETARSLLFDFNKWVEEEGKQFGLRATSYEKTAVRKAKAFWAPTVRRLFEMIGAS